MRTCLVIGVALSLTLALAACIADPTLPCGDSRCPTDDVCTLAGCTTPANAAACADQADGSACTSPTITRGACGSGACHEVVCGDGVRELNEVCDDGNTVSGDGCSADCLSNETCGNGIVDLAVGEQCDDGFVGRSNDGCDSRCRIESVGWSDVTPQPIAARAATALAYDATRDVVVAFGGFDNDTRYGDTWEWRLNRWTEVFPAHSPSPRAAHGMVATPAGQLLFGGNADTLLGDTWLWDGDDWTELHPATSPSPRREFAMAYDPVRDRVVVFGGDDATTTFGDTWEWDGTTWTQKATTGPVAQTRSAMAYDPINQVVLLYGGDADLHQTWAWDGNAWTELAPATSPVHPATACAIATESSGDILLFGGVGDDNLPDAQTWEWDGSAWSQRSFSADDQPPARSLGGLTTDGLNLLLFGGTNIVDGTVLGDTWVVSAGAWIDAVPPSTSPPARAFQSAVYDPIHGDIVMFGGQTLTRDNDTWEWASGQWNQMLPTTAPTPPRSHQAMVYDVARATAVVFGGGTGPGSNLDLPLGDTWEWDGSDWSHRTIVHAPAAREAAAFAYDIARGEAILFGGWDGSNEPGFADTWAFGSDGIWREQTPSTSPPPRQETAAAYDPGRDRIVMFGGFDGSQELADTWEWDGTTWTELTPATSPPARQQHAMAYDPMRRRVVLAGGGADGDTTFFSDAWEWDGSNWTELATETTAPIRIGTSLAYDDIERRMIGFGGLGVETTDDDTFALTWQVLGTSTERCLLATADDDGDSLAGCADPDCWGRCSPLCPPGLSCAPSEPHCGDGVCSEVEDALICPSDCS